MFEVFFPDIKTVFVILCNQTTVCAGGRKSYGIVHLMINAGHSTYFLYVFVSFEVI